MFRRGLVRSGLLGAAVAGILLPAIGHAQPAFPAPALVPQSPEFAAVRAKFEGMSEAQVRAAGYQVDTVCVDAAEAGLPPALGGMGYHAVNPRLFGEQFPTGRLDARNPPLLLLDASKKVVGIEWEARASVQPAPVLFDQTVAVLPGHPGPAEVNVPHYMLHAYFKPNGMVLFSVFDPALKCPAAAAPAAAQQAAQPAQPGRPAQVPMALPRTGGALDPTPITAGLGALLAGAGMALRRRSK